MGSNQKLVIEALKETNATIIEADKIKSKLVGIRDALYDQLEDLTNVLDEDDWAIIQASELTIMSKELLKIVEDENGIDADFISVEEIDDAGVSSHVSIVNSTELFIV